LKGARKKSAQPRFERKLPDARRQALVEATIECLKRFGHDGLSIRRISAQAKVSIGLINHHFPTMPSLPRPIGTSTASWSGT
jgi:TetR/AcrR family transcriptional repressor of bet genes